ncbi:MAG: XRE family transcriptional regulator [Clostridia bacterium]|nr:XRE family transcriptional regulator [Clostridia bacterium]NCC62289.1 XRE family transcriptional regulator [Verrucomicrobiae bacterium]
MGVGENIARIRARAGMTQAELSEKIGIHVVTLSNWEREKRGDPGAKDLQRMAQILGCGVEEFLNPPKASELTHTKA